MLILLLLVRARPMSARRRAHDLNMLGWLIGVPAEALIRFVLAITGQADERRDRTRLDRPARRQLVLDLDGYEGPIDLLLALAREQKVDLAQDLDPGAGRPVSRLYRRAAPAAARDRRRLPGHGGLARLSQIAPAAARAAAGRASRAAPSWPRRWRIACGCWRRCSAPARALMARPQLGRDVFAARRARRARGDRPSRSTSSALYELLQRLWRRPSPPARRRC